MIKSLTTYLEHRLKKELPGKEAHLEVAPYRRVEFTENDIQQAKKSSVLILFYHKNNTIYTALMQRTRYKGSHSGQVSFPGGKAEPYDNSILHTALREANEELGINSNEVSIIGQLTEVYIPVSNFHVVPFIGITSKTPQFVLEKKEVEEVIELNIPYFVQQQLTTNKVKMANNTIVKVPSFEYEQKIIWGATALMLNELKYILSDWDALNTFQP